MFYTLYMHYAFIYALYILFIRRIYSYFYSLFVLIDPRVLKGFKMWTFCRIFFIFNGTFAALVYKYSNKVHYLHLLTIVQSELFDKLIT